MPCMHAHVISIIMSSYKNYSYSFVEGMNLAKQYSAKIDPPTKSHSYSCVCMTTWMHAAIKTS